MIALFQEDIWTGFKTVKDAVERVISPLILQEEMTAMQAYVLAGIRIGTVTNVSTLCNEMSMSQSNASTMCKRLEQAGLLERKRSIEDERVVELYLTKVGEEKLDRITKRFEIFDEVIASYPMEELEKIKVAFDLFMELVGKMDDVLKTVDLTSI